MWTELIVLNLVALRCTVSSSPPSPINVTFSSVNLRNVLQWFPGNGTPDDTHFTVQYAIYGDSVEGRSGRPAHWRAVPQCQNIVRSWCDLSSETWDLEQGYNARVRAVSGRASSKWARTRRRFDPKTDTSFGPPLVSVDIEDNSATITLKGPMRYQPNNHTPAVSMAALYHQMTYNLSIYNTRRSKTSHFPVASSPYKYRLMEYNTEYCFSAKSRFISMPVECQSSEWQCITTPPDPVIGQLQNVVVGIVVPSVCMCMLVLVGYLLHHYLTGKGQKTPYTLNRPSFYEPPLMFPPEKPIVITVIKPSDIEVSISDPAFSRRRIADPPPGYSSQRPGTPSQPNEPWDDSSIDYGFLSVAPKLNVRGEEEEREKRHDGGEDGNNARGEHQKCVARDCYKMKEWRVEDGHSAGDYAPQAKSAFSQKSAHTCSQTHTPIHTETHAHTEMSTLLQAHAFSQVNSVVLAQTQAPLQSFQGATRGGLDRGFPHTNPQIGHSPFNLQTKGEGGMGEEMDGKVSVRTDGGIDGGKSERVPLLSAYASKNIDMPTSRADQSDFLPDDYGVLKLATAYEIKEDGDEKEEEGTICINWDPKTRKLMFPEMAMEVNEEGRLDSSMQGEKGRENRVGGEEEEMYVKKGLLRLENVYVRQGSEEKAEVQREMETGRETRWEADDILSKWDLVISMDQ